MGSYEVVSAGPTYTRVRFFTTLHGSNAASGASGSYPNISIYAYVEFTRALGSSTVNWNVYDIGWDDHDWSGHFDYRFCANIGVDGAAAVPSNTIMSMEQQDYHYNWWNDMWFGSPSGSFTSTIDTTYVIFYVECRNCWTSEGGWYHACFDNGEGDYPVETFYDIPLPTYETKYDVTYDADGGTPVPQTQQKSSTSDLTITSTIPSKSVTVNYYKLSGSLLSSVSPNMVFDGWMCSVNSQIYTYPQKYTLNQACTMTAQWGAASYIPPALPSEYFKLTLVYNNGSASSETSLARVKSGYGTSPNASASKYPGQTYTTSDNVNLYCIYGSATVVYSRLPKPTKTGYAFKGWFKDSACTQEITGNYTIDANTTIYAGWTPLPVHKRLSNGTWSNEGPTVWKYTNSGWVKTTDTACVYKYEQNVGWVNKSK